MTFSIVATDGTAAGVAVASKFLAVGSVVPEVRLGADGRLVVGAAATQATAKWSYKIDAVRLLGEGHDAAFAVDQVTAADAEREHRQLGVVGVDSQATYTGAQCLDWAGGRSGADAGGRYAIQGNILVGEQVVAEMERAWLDTRGVAARAPAHRGPARRRRGRRGRPGPGERGPGRAWLPARGTTTAGSGWTCGSTSTRTPRGSWPGSSTSTSSTSGRPRTSSRWSASWPTRSRHGCRGSATTGRPSDALSTWAGVENYEMRLTDEGIDARVLRALRDATTG